MSGAVSGSPGGQPSTTQPIAGPWLSPQVVTRNRWPKVLWDIARAVPESVGAPGIRGCGCNPRPARRFGQLLGAPGRARKGRTRAIPVTTRGRRSLCGANVMRRDTRRVAKEQQRGDDRAQRSTSHASTAARRRAAGRRQAHASGPQVRGRQFPSVRPRSAGRVSQAPVKRGGTAPVRPIPSMAAPCRPEQPASSGRS